MKQRKLARGLRLGGLILLLMCSTGSAHGNQSVATIDAAAPPTIVVPEQPTETERFAAQELARYLGRQLDATLPIQTLSSSTPANGMVIEIGRTAGNLSDQQALTTPLIEDGNDSFIIAVEPERIRLVGGGDRGTLYAAYALLEMTGCRWFAPGASGEIVPTFDHIDLPVGKQAHRPANITREIGGGPIAGQDPLELVDWSAKNRLNRKFALRDGYLQRLTDHPEAAKAWAKRGGMESWQWIAHNFSFMFPAEENWFERHPEYFALYKGKRVPLGTPGRPGYGGGNLALTNPDVVDHAARFAIEWFDKNPQGTVVPMWPGDGAIKWDESPEAMDLGGRNFTRGEEGSMTRRMATFSNAVARQVAERHPDRLILLPAYANYLLPIPGLELEPNIFVQYCYHGDYAHGPEQSPVNAEAAERMRVWAEQAEHFGVWEYFLIGDYTVTEPVPVILPLVYRVRDTMRFLDSIGSRRYFTQSNNVYQKYNPLVYYATARYAWDPSLDADALIDDFCIKSYGPDAGAKVASFYKAIERSCQASDWRPTGYSDVAQPSPKVFTESLLVELEALLAEAEAAEMTQEQSDRLALVREAFDHTRANIGTLTAAGLDTETPWRLERGEDAYVVNADGPDIDKKRFDDLVRHAIDTGDFSEQFERMVFRARKRSEPIVWIENDALRVGVLPGLGGRLIRLVDKRTGHNFMEEHPGTTTLDSIGDRYFNYGGYEEYIGRDFAGPGWEWAYDSRVVQQPDATAIVVTATTDDWRLERTYLLPRGDRGELSVESRLTNRSASPVTTLLRTHPQFTLGDDGAELALLIQAENGSIRQTTLDEQHDGVTIQPAGAWAVIHPDQERVLLHRFEAKQAQPYLFKGDGYFQLELFGQTTTLAPEQTLVMRQHVAVNDDPAELKKLLREPMPRLSIDRSPLDDAPANTRLRVDPIEENVELVPGQVGRAGGFSGEPNSGLLFDSRLLRANAGTVEFWVKLPQSLEQTPHGWLVSIGSNSPSWWYIVAGGGQLAFLSKAGQKPFTGPNEHYASLPTGPLDWPAETWHHVALAWADGGPGQALLRWYVDGEPILEHSDLTLGGAFSTPHIGIGRNTAAQNGRFVGAIDELRISNRPRNAAEIRASYERGRARQPLQPDDATLLLIDFDKGATGVSQTRAGLDSQAIASQIRELATEPASE